MGRTKVGLFVGYDIAPCSEFLYDVATSIVALIEAGEMDRAFFLESTDHLIGILSGKVREGERELSHWDHNVLKTAIAVEAILSVIKMGFPGPKKLDYFRVILSSIDYVFSVQTPGFGGWGDTCHTGRVVYALAMLIKQVEPDVELQEEFQTPKEGIALRMHMGLMDLAETQMPNGKAGMDSDRGTSTGIIAFIYSGEEKPFSEVQISLPAASFQALVDAFSGDYPGVCLGALRTDGVMQQEEPRVQRNEKGVGVDEVRSDRTQGQQASSEVGCSDLARHSCGFVVGSKQSRRSSGYYSCPEC